MVNKTGEAQRSRILHLLREAEKPLSGVEIGRVLGISRVAVHKHIRSLENREYPVSSARSGYRIGEEPALPLTSWEFLPEEHITVIPRVDSTMNRAGFLAERFPGRDFTIAAETQERGRGRRNRKWDSPYGGLWATRVFHPPGSSLRLQLYVLAAAAGLAGLLREQGIDAQLKWPNDVYVNGRKIAGVLGEARVTGDRFDYLAMGLGMNLNNSVRGNAVALKDITGREEDRREWLRRWVGAFHSLADSPRFASEDSPHRWDSLMPHSDEPVSFTLAAGTPAVTSPRRTSARPAAPLTPADPALPPPPETPAATAAPVTPTVPARPAPVTIVGTAEGIDNLGRLKIRTRGDSLLHLAPGDIEETAPNSSRRYT